jgi:hypothetical protein
MKTGMGRLLIFNDADEGSIFQLYALAILHMDQIGGFLVSEIMCVFPL